MLTARRLALALLAAMCAIFSALGLSSGAFALPEGRVYERVSPAFKAGYPVIQPEGTAEKSALAIDGEAVKFSSVGAFAGAGEDFAANPYVARRSPNGWAIEALNSNLRNECFEIVGGPQVFSPDLSQFELVARLGASEDACSLSSTTRLWVRQEDGSLTEGSPLMTTAGGSAAVEPQPTILGASADLSHSVITRPDGPSAHILPGDDTEAGTQLFETDASSVRLIGLDNVGHQLTRSCNVELGGNGRGDHSEFGAVSEPGASEVFFHVDCEADQLYVRVDGRTTVEVSKPLLEACSEVPCPGAATRAPAHFQGASEDGSKVFFTTAEPLVEGDNDHSNNLYMATIGCAGGGEGEACGAVPREVTSLRLISGDAIAGQGAEVESNVVAVSPDGSHVYFVARGVLSQAANGEGEGAVDGAENLYVYDANVGGTSFIADLCSGPERSGAVTDGHCPSSL